MDDVDTSMEGFNTKYTIRDGAVYWRRRPVKHADAGTFQPLGGAWGADRESVFVQDRRKKIDRSTFRYLNPVFVLDCDAVYDWIGPIKNADPVSFDMLDPGIEARFRILQETCRCGYGRDKDHVFYHYQMVGRATAVRGADPATFRSLRNGYGMDYASVFFGKDRLKNSHPRSWVHLGRGYSADRERVFYYERELLGVDRTAFTVVGLPTYGNYATDGKRWFQNDVEVTAKQFLEGVEQSIEVYGKWFVNNPLMRKGLEQGHQRRDRVRLGSRNRRTRRCT